MTRRILAVIALAMLGTVPADAQLWWSTPSSTPGATGSTTCPSDRTWGDIGVPRAIGATETDSRTVQFTGRTLSAADSLTVKLIYGTDSSPSSIVSGSPSYSGSQMSARFAPDTGCGTSGCRDGNWYQLTWCATSGGDHPCIVTCLQVKTSQYAKP